jgi:hypothetical protein
MLAGDTTLDHPTEAFAGVFVDDGDDLDRPPVGGDIELEIRRPPESIKTHWRPGDLAKPP